MYIQIYLHILDVPISLISVRDDKDSEDNDPFRIITTTITI